ncbi:MAG: pilin [Candidatus Pacebacteria bacterium]|jgi:hypothetical protein|nr:pilin [Candidatus Paceibacterota bacterium]
MKKNAFGVFLALSAVWISGFCASSLYASDIAATDNATGYEPLVKIPGVDATEVNISNYLIGIYNFLLSIVGIVAVVMLIIGGMKYIMAAGSGGAVSSAKETIKDAILGLLLALLSYVIVGTINPDVLYLRQPGATFSKDNAAASYVGTFSSPIDSNGNGVQTVIYTSPEGYQREMSLDTAEQIKSGATVFEPLASDKVALMKKNLSCIFPGSPRTNSDPYFTGYCTCLTEEKTPLPVGETDCNVACERKDMCGFKFISVKLNARHGYTVNGNIDSNSATGDTATGASSEDNETQDVKDVYDLTADTQVHSDELWELEGTNKANWGGVFDIVYSTSNTMQNTQGGTTTTKTEPKKYVEKSVGDFQEIYPCAILVTNQEEQGGDDEHWVYWVTLGTTLGGNSMSLYENIKNGYISGCDEGGGTYYGISQGECDQAWTDRVLLARYGDDVVDKCDYCALADGQDEKVYRFGKTLTCQGGYWQ